MKHIHQRIIHLLEMPTGGSDNTLKKDIRAIEDSLSTVLALRPVTWKWKTDKTQRTNYGFIAQEVEKVLPHLVTEEEWEDGSTRKFLATNNIMPYAISAIKEQHEEITVLLEAIKEQQKEIFELKKALKELKTK